MQQIEKTFELAVPVSTAYRQWLHFDKAKGWGGEITERVDNQMIAWRSGADAGRVRFEPVSEQRTRVRVAMEAGDEGELAPRVEKTVDEFRHFVGAGKPGTAP